MKTLGLASSVCGQGFSHEIICQVPQNNETRPITRPARGYVINFYTSVMSITPNTKSATTPNDRCALAKNSSVPGARNGPMMTSSLAWNCNDRS
jgi:hypothetical protein